MRSLKKSLLWRIGYGLFCLVYVAWMVYLSLNNLGMLHNDYRRAGERLQPERIKEIALQELVDQCRREAKHSDRVQSFGNKGSVVTADACLAWPPDVLEARRQGVEGRLVDERSGTFRKLLLCYVFFGVVFLILPLVFLYLLLSFFIWIFKSIKVVK